MIYFRCSINVLFGHFMGPQTTHRIQCLGGGRRSTLGELKIILNYKFPRLWSCLTRVWKDKPGGCLLFETFIIFSLSRVTANVLKPNWLVLVGQLGTSEVVYRFFSGFSCSALGSCKEEHKPCHGECRSECPQNKKSGVAELSELLGQR